MSNGLLPILLALTPLGVGPEPATSASEAWSRLTGCGAAMEDFRDWEQVLGCQAAARDVLRLGDETDRERMWDRFESHAEPFRALLLKSLVESYVSDAVRQLDDDARAPAGPAPAAAPTDFPKALETASAELKDAYLFFRGAVSRAWPDSTAPEDERIAYVSVEGREQFQQLVAEFLRGSSDTSATRAALERFEWGGACGNGAGEFLDALSAVRLIASLREGRIDADAAVAYAFGAWPLDGEHAPGTDERLLKAAGLDWERLYVGALVARGPWHIAPLLRAGSDRSARLLLEIAGLARDDSFPGEAHQVLAPLAAFVSSEGPCEGHKTVSSEDVGRDEGAPPIGAEVQQSILEALAGQVQPGAGLDAAQAASHALLRLCRIESHDAFSAMLRSPYAQVRERGAIGLRALGESVAEPTPSAPVAFRMIVDGRPWPTAVSWQLEGPHGFRGGSETPDRDGVVRVERDPFLDPTTPVESVTLASERLTSPERTWFSVRFRPPADLDDRTLLNVRTGALTVLVPPSVRTSAGGQPEALLILQAHVEDEDHSVGHLSVRAGSYHFPHLQHGTYTASVMLPDGTLLESSEVEVGERPQTVALAPVPRTQDTIEMEDSEEVDTPR